MEKAIQARTVTYDFARLLKGARKVSCSGFGEAIVRQMGTRTQRQDVKKAKSKPSKKAKRLTKQRRRASRRR